MTINTFQTSVLGSWPRSKKVLRSLRDRRTGRITEEEFHAITNEETLKILKAQEEAGIDIVTDGEQRRDNFISFVAEKIGNVKMLSVSELLDFVEDKSSFEEILGTLDVPAYSLTNPAAYGKIYRKEPIALNEYLFLREHTEKGIKVAIPGPYILSRSMWIEGLSEDAYPTRKELAEDVVKVLREEIEALIDAGVSMIQLDEPVLTEVVFTQSNANRTFMCGALTAKADAEEELEFATSLINQLLKDLPRKNTKIGLHICRGNWSTDESILLRGPYDPLIPYLKRMKVDQFILEYSTPRAGELKALSSLTDREDVALGLGVVNPRTTEIETVAEIVSRVEEAATYFPIEKISLNPDCGFGTFAQRPMNSPKIATRKLSAMSKAANILREKYE